MLRIGPGDGVEVLPAYDADTGYRTLEDEVAYCAGEVLTVRQGDAHLRLLDGREVWVTVTRLKRARL